LGDLYDSGLNYLDEFNQEDQKREETLEDALKNALDYDSITYFNAIQPNENFGR
jgi:hypothetical protein